MQYPVSLKSIAVGLMVLAGGASLSACELCCALCGREEAENKVCRLVCVDKKVTVTCWACETEDFCLPPPNWRTCRHYDLACEDPNDPDRKCYGLWHKYFVWSEWKPCGCAKLATKKRLMKKTMTKTVPSYKWVVEDLCPACEADCELFQVPAGVQIPPAPPIDDVKIIGSQPKDTAK